MLNGDFVLRRRKRPDSLNFTDRINTARHDYIAITRGFMQKFKTKRLSVDRDAVAPDGSDVRILLDLQGGGMAHFKLPPGKTSIAVTHKTVEEIWFFLSGRGQMWRRMGNQEEVVLVEEGVCITIPLGTHFQFRSFDFEPLAAIGVTMPPWPGEGEATIVKGKWEPTLP